MSARPAFVTNRLVFMSTLNEIPQSLALRAAGFQLVKTVHAPAIGGSMGNAVTQLARTLDARHAVSTTTSLAKAVETLQYFVEGRSFGRVPRSHCRQE